uniref:Uncharacterized protein n=1 Tax=Rhizophagus irregularis (strain DAOM 181602 / DAOM 197198 / MUCL 43194) TaxID=747089 RepID=U9UFD7_RHIID
MYHELRGTYLAFQRINNQCTHRYRYTKITSSFLFVLRNWQLSLHKELLIGNYR